MKKLTGFLCLTFFAFAITGFSQVRPPDSSEEPEVAKEEEKAEEVAEEKQVPLEKNLPDSLKVKYQGGLIGFRKKQHGTIKFDVINERLVFFGEDGKEKFSLPYETIIAVDPSPKKVQSGAGRVVNAVPYLGILGNFMKKRKNYMVIHFEDPDVDVRGNLNFLFDTKALLKMGIDTVGQNAEMKKRGEAYVRGKTF